MIFIIYIDYYYKLIHKNKVTKKDSYSQLLFISIRIVNVSKEIFK